MKNKIIGLLAAIALMFTGMVALSGPASAAPPPVQAATAVAPVGGMAASSYHIWCNWYGTFCKKTRRYNAAGGYYYWDICSNIWCSEFYNFKDHPPLSKAKAVY